MSRAIRLNSAAGGIEASAGSSGLTSSDVKTLIAQNSEWVLDTQTGYSSAQSYPFTIISSVDFDNVQAYRVIMKNWGASSQGYCYLNIQKGSSSISGTSQWQYQMYRDSAAAYVSSNTSFSGGDLQLSAGQTDAIEGSNWREMTIWINKLNAPNNGRRQFSVLHENGIPAASGYQTFRKVTEHHVVAAEDFDAFGIGFTGSASTSPSSLYGDSNIYVYKKLRVPAS
jgi:hypothetical protein